MKWDSALRAMKNGKKIAREDWVGYWYIASDGEIWINFLYDVDGTKKDGFHKVLFRGTKDMATTLEHCGYADWYVVE